MAGKPELKSEGGLAFAGWLCPECGYDLSGLREAVCPECGTAIECRVPEERLWPRWVGGIAALAVSVACSMFGLVTGFLSYEDHLRYLGHRCCRGSGDLWFLGPMPVVLVMAIGTLLIAKRRGFAASVARLGVVALSALWVTGLVAMWLAR